MTAVAERSVEVADTYLAVDCGFLNDQEAANGVRGGGLVTSKMQLAALVAEARKSDLMGYDTETSGIEWFKHRLFGASFCFDGETGWFVTRDLMPELARALGDPSLAKVAHNTKFDLHHTREAGVTMAGTLYDTEVLARVWDENQLNYKLKDLCARIFGGAAKEAQDGLKTWMKENGVEDYSKVPLEVMVPYACQDAVLVVRLFRYLKQQILEKDKAKPDGIMSLWDVVEREAKVTKIVAEMERTGHLVDLKFLQDYKVTLAADQAVALKTVLDLAGEDFNPGSDEQVSRVMLKLGWVPKEKTKTGANKTDKYALDDWDHPFSAAMLDWRRCGKLITTYCDGMADRAVHVQSSAATGLHMDGSFSNPGKWIGVIHPDYRTNGASTGRFSCTNPNLQNTDKKSEARTAFVVRPGYVNVYLDFKQIEVCGFAYYANDKLMQDALWEGADYHMMNAEVIYGKPRAEITKDERDKAKQFNFMLLYGAGDARVAKALRVPLAEAGMFKKNYFARFTTVKRLSYKCQDAIRGKGYVTNRFGRRRNLKAEDAYKAMNALIQSWAADLLKESMVRVDTALRAPLGDHDAAMLLQIHDELILQIRDDGNFGTTLQTVVNAMESVGELVSTVPIRVDVKYTRTNWHQRKELSREDLLAVYQRGLLDGPGQVPELRESPAASATGAAQ